MKVKELIEWLKTCDSEKDVEIIVWDGGRKYKNDAIIVRQEIKSVVIEN